MRGLDDASLALLGPALEAKLTSMGFARGVLRDEVIYTRVHDRCVHTRMTVYTTLSNGRAGNARGLGEDSIKITGFYERLPEGTSRGFRKAVFKSKRCFRTGSVEAVIERVYERAREAYGECNVFLREQKCFACSRPANERRTP